MKRILCPILCIALLCGCESEQTGSVTKEDSHELAFTVGGTSEYVHGYDTMKEMARDSKFVIYGEVLDSFCQAEEYFIFTYDQVRVNQVLYGDCEVGDTIYVRKTMGEVTLAEYIEGLKMISPNSAEEYEEKYSTEEQETLYVQWENPDEIESEVGQKSIYFLDELGIPEECNEYHAYGRINDAQGQYIEFTKENFQNVRDYAHEKADTNTVRTGSTEPLEQATVYTYEEIRDEIIQ